MITLLFTVVCFSDLGVVWVYDILLAVSPSTLRFHQIWNLKMEFLPLPRWYLDDTSLHTVTILLYDSRRPSLEIMVRKECNQRISESNDVTHRHRMAQDHSINVKHSMTVVLWWGKSQNTVYFCVTAQYCHYGPSANICSSVFALPGPLYYINQAVLLLQCRRFQPVHGPLTLHYSFKILIEVFFLCLSKGWCGYDGADPALRMYEVMSGDTLSWKVPSPRQSDSESNPESHFTGDGGPVKILKVCFCTNNNLGKNFKLVKCDSSWQIRVRVI